MLDMVSTFEEDPSTAWQAYESWRKKNEIYLNNEDVFEETRDKLISSPDTPNNFYDE